MSYPADALLVTEMDSAAYHADRSAVSASGLAEMARTPLHFWHRYLRPGAIEPPSTPAQLLGTAVHMAVLEPERFAEHYSVRPDVDGRTTGGKEALRIFREGLELAGAVEIHAEHHAVAVAVAHEVTQHPMGRRLLTGAGKRECSVFWTDEETGVRCRMRPDFVPEAVPFIVDLKSTRNAAEYPFGLDCWRMRYYVSAAFYVDGYRALTTEKREYVWVAWETEPPFAPAFFYASPDLIEAGRAEYRKCLRLYAKCMAADDWPGYFSELQAIEPPAWATDGR